jgi:hypothetical protein
MGDDQRHTVRTDDGQCKTQRVTAADLRVGQIRIPSSTTSAAKALFPESESELAVKLKGRPVRGLWNPGMDPDRERSGVLRIGTQLQELVHPDEVLLVTVERKGLICLD